MRMSRFLLLNFEDFGLNQDITQTIQSHTLFCICCFKKNIPLINLSSCPHASYLDRFAKPELKPFNRVACSDCHRVLKEIHVFNNKIEKNFKLLASESFDISKVTNRTSDLEIKKTVDILLTPSDSEDNVRSPVPPPKANDDQEQTKKQTNIRTALDILSNIQNLNMGLKQSSMVPGQEILNTVIQLLGTVSNLPKRSLVEKEKSKVEVNVKREMIEIEVPPVNATIQGTSFNVSSSKVQTIPLTKEELMRERSLEAQSQEYLRHPYKCESCIVGFYYEENLQDHVARKHATDAAGSVATCEVCLQILQAEHMNEHKFRHYTRYDCTVCKKRFVSFSEAWSHTGEHRKNGERTKYKCPVCDYTTEYSHKYKLHKLSHGKFPCPECGVILTRASSRRKHMALVHSKRSLDCEKCKASFDSEMAYKKHMQTHAYCAPCNLRFTTWHAYCMHMRLSNAHSSKLRRYKCGDCSMRFTTLAQRRLHTESRHAKTDVITCKYCTKTFVSEKQWKSHVDLHLEKKKRNDVIFCDHCYRAYNSRRHLIRHLESHAKKVIVKSKQT